MRKLIYDEHVSVSKFEKGFAFWPTIVIEAHPTNRRWHLIWWECYEIDRGKKWLIKPYKITCKACIEHDGRMHTCNKYR